MRQIEFRGLRITGSGFTYGNLHYDRVTKKYYIASDHVYKNSIGVMATNCYEVFPESVGQYTGKRDSLGFKIYEGDKIEFDPKQWGDNTSNIHVVEWDEEDGRWSWGGGLTSDMEFRTVVGNIHETK